VEELDGDGNCTKSTRFDCPYGQEWDSNTGKGCVKSSQKRKKLIAFDFHGTKSTQHTSSLVMQ
tara:strand:- start:738 stop:926 length:189 start_codon:yes stop_codon:yes gene_type:complete